MAVKTCPKCKGKVSETRDVCPHCEYIFNSMPMICPDCESEVEIGASECPVCGFYFSTPDTCIEDSMNLDLNLEIARDTELPTVNGNSRISRGKVGILPREVSKEDFIKKALLFLKDSTNTSVDIFDATFGEVVEEEIEIIVASGRANINYAREIGYDRDEQYIEEVCVTTGSYDRVDSSGNKYRREVRTRKVTDWKPDHGTLAGKGIFTALNTDKKYPQTFISSLQLDIIEDKVGELEERDVNQVYTKKFPILERGIASNVYYSSVPKMGDSQRNDRYDYTIDNFFYEIYVVPLFSINISLRGKTYKITSVALNHKRCFINEEDPKIDISGYENKKIELVKEINKNKEKIHNIRIPFFIGLFFFFAIGLSLLFSGSLVLGIIFASLGALSIAVYFLLSYKKKNIEKLLKAYEENFKKHCKNKKSNDYIKKLKEFNFAYDGAAPEADDFDLTYYEELYKKSFLFNFSGMSKAPKEKDEKKQRKFKKALLIAVLSIIGAGAIACAIIFSNPIKYAKNSDGTYAVVGCKSYVTNVEIPATYRGKPVTDIDSVAFAYDNIESIVIPDSIKRIGERAFNDCRNLKSVYYNGTITDWCNIYFEDNTSTPMIYATEFYLLDKDGDVRYKGESYSLLTDIVFDDTVNIICRYNFNGFENLTSVLIPNSVKQISEYAFSGCNNLTLYCEAEHPVEASYDEEGKYYSGWNYDWNSRRPVCWGVKELIANIEQDNIEYAITDIGAILLSYNGASSELSIPSTVAHNGKTYSVTRIGEYAFHECYSLTSITIPDSVTNISPFAFSYCGNLTSILIPDSVINIGGNIFENCTNLTIYCEAESQPEGWSSSWNDRYSHNLPQHIYITVVWGYKETN